MYYIVKVMDQLDATKYAVFVASTLLGGWGHILRAVLTPSSPALHNPGGFPGMAN
jgi:hypothetical protein